MSISFGQSLLSFVALVCVGAYAGTIVSDSWIQIATPLNPPSARHSHTAVFHSVKGALVVFGGVYVANGVSTPYNDVSTYTVDADLWETSVANDTAPLPRYGHSAVVTGLDVMVVFGGQNGSEYFNDVAVYDLLSNTWMNTSVDGTPPSPRAYHTAVVDSYQHAMYVYGGTDGNSYLDDLYVLDLDNMIWTQVNVSGGVARAMHSAVMTQLGTMIVFGGIGLSDITCFSVRNHTWYTCLDEKSRAPQIRYGHTAVISPLGKMLVFGGKNEAGFQTSDSWNYDLFTNTWSYVTPSGTGVGSRAFHSSTATTFGTMIVFGGVDGDGATSDDFGLYNLANTVLRNSNDGAVLVILVTLLGSILLALCFAMEYMQEQNIIEKDEAIAKAKADQAMNDKLLLPNLPAIPKALQIPLGPRAQKFFDEFKMSLDPMHDPPK